MTTEDKLHLLRNVLKEMEWKFGGEEAVPEAAQQLKALSEIGIENANVKTHRWKFCICCTDDEMWNLVEKVMALPRTRAEAEYNVMKAEYNRKVGAGKRPKKPPTYPKLVPVPGQFFQQLFMGLSRDACFGLLQKVTRDDEPMRMKDAMAIASSAKNEAKMLTFLSHQLEHENYEAFVLAHPWILTNPDVTSGLSALVKGTKSFSQKDLAADAAVASFVTKVKSEVKRQATMKKQEQKFQVSMFCFVCNFFLKLTNPFLETILEV
jgi:hypothetical protein